MVLRVSQTMHREPREEKRKFWLTRRAASVRVRDMNKGLHPQENQNREDSSN